MHAALAAHWPLGQRRVNDGANGSNDSRQLISQALRLMPKIQEHS
jgi:hypothetical protein